MNDFYKINSAERGGKGKGRARKGGREKERILIFNVFFLLLFPACMFPHVCFECTESVITWRGKAEQKRGCRVMLICKGAKTPQTCYHVVLLTTKKRIRR